MKYPYIGKGTESGTIALIYGKDSAIVMDSKTWAAKNGDDKEVEESCFTNITREYLANTYGKVESKEHAEFIVELACEFSNRTGFTDKYPCWFCFDEDEIFFFEDKSDASSDDEKQITIPIPPKNHAKLAINGDTADLDSMLTFKADSIKVFDAMGNMVSEFNSASNGDDNLLNNGDNLLFGGEDKCKEWPCVGDEVMFNDLLQHYDQYKEDYCGKPSKVIARFNTTEGEFITVHREYCAVMTVRIDRVLKDGALIKPKTPEGELRDEIAKSIDAESSDFANVFGVIERVIAAGYITKKPQ